MDKPNENNENCRERLMNTNFEEIFYQSPIGIFFYDKEGRLTNANDSALNIARIPKLDNVLDTNIFDNPILASKKEELHEKGLIKFQDSLDLIQIKEHNIYNPLEPKIINIDWTVSVTDSGYLVQIQDITEIKKSESALKLKEAQFEVLTENIHLGVALIDETGRFVVVNPAFMKIFDLDNKLDILNVNNQDWNQWKVYGEDNKLLDVDEHPVRKVAITGKPIMDQSVKLKNPGDNKFKWLLVSAVPILNKDSSINMIICTYYDVTSHKKDEEALKESQEEYSNLFERMNEGFTIAEMIYNNDGKPFDFRWIDMNHAYEKVIGFTRDKLLKTTARTIFPKLQPKLIENFGKVMLTGKQLQFENYNVELNKWFDVIAYKITQKHFAYLTLDITQRKKADELLQKLLENEQHLTEELQVTNEELVEQGAKLLQINQILEESEKRFRSIIENIQDAYMRADKEGTIIMASPSAARMYRFNSIQEMLGTTTHSYFKNSEDRDLAIEKLKNHGKYDDYEVEGRRNDGTFFWVSQNAQYYYDDQGNIQGSETIVRDITERKKADKQIEFDSLLLSQVKDAILAVDNNFRITYWNKGAEMMFGYTQKEALGSNTVKLLRPKYDPEEREKIGAFASTMYAKHKNGKDVIVDQKISQMVDDSGLQTGYVIVDRDITEKIKIDHELKESEEKYRNIVEIADEGIMIADTSGRINFVNAKMTEMLGYSSEELLGTNAETFVDKDYYELGLQKIANRKKGIRESYEIKYNRKNGDELWCLISATPMYDYTGKHIGNMTMQTDITESKKANDILQESESRFHSVLDNSQDVIYRINVQTGVYEYVSPSTENIFGYSPDELMALATTDPLTTIHPDDRIKFQNGITELEKNDKVEMEYRHQTKNGEYCWISNNLGLIRDSTGKPLYRDGNMRDITNRKRLEEQMKITMDELKRSNAELERFAYVSSHDLQEPLRMVTLYSQLLERRYKDNLDSDANDFIEYIVEGSNRMRQLIDDLLEYSRLTSQTTEFESVSLETVLDNVLRNLSISIVEYNATISPDPLPTVFANKNQMQQVFQNLITNSIKFHGPKSPEINISAQKGQTYWTFSISDNGIGIKPEHQKQIFDVFKRLHTRDEYPGTGIGLSIVQKIINHHNGQIWVESEPGKGSTFYFTIPIK
jgi:PAS domain S-box-containing protein